MYRTQCIYTYLLENLYLRVCLCVRVFVCMINVPITMHLIISLILQGAEDGGSRYYRSRKMSGVRCYNCDELGHLSRDCPKEKVDRVISCIYINK